METITLGDREYQLKEKPVRKAEAYLALVKVEFADIIALIEGAPDTETSDKKEVASLMRAFSNVLFGSVGKTLDLLVQYDEALMRDREYIEENALGSQVVDGFIAVLMLVFPFFGSARIGRAINMIQAVGSKSKSTKTN